MELFSGRVFAFVFFSVFTIALFYWYRLLVQKRAKVDLIELPAFKCFDEAVARSAEMRKPVHYCLGVGEVEGSVVASFKLLGYVARKCAELDTKIIVPVAFAEEQPMVEEILNAAYREKGKSELVTPDCVRFTSKGFAYTNSIFAIFEREQPGANFMLGPFFNESLLIGSAGRRVGSFQIGGTVRSLQIPFFVATCDYALIGEEMLVAGAYLSQDPLDLACVAIEDVGKMFALFAMLAGTLMTTFGSKTIVNLLGM